MQFLKTHFLFSVFQKQKIGNRKSKTENGKLEIKNRKPENRKQKTKNQKSETGKQKTENRKLETGNWKQKTVFCFLKSVYKENFSITHSVS